MNVERPIGVFDSGMGGLTVLAALRRAMPERDFIYLGDTARLPYGTKSSRTVMRYAHQAAARLVAEHVGALVVACNTAAGIALDHLAEHFPGIPVFGVVEPGARAACAVDDGSGILVLATEATVQGGAYQRAIHAQAAHAKIYARACPLWVTLAEQGPDAAEIAPDVLAHGLGGWLHEGPGTLVLGCTHFPVFTRRLAELFEARGRSVSIVDSAETTAATVAQALGATESTRNPGTLRLMATDGVARFRRVGRYFLGEPIGELELVDL